MRKFTAILMLLALLCAPLAQAEEAGADAAALNGIVAGYLQHFDEALAAGAQTGTAAQDGASVTYAYPAKEAPGLMRELCFTYDSMLAIPTDSAALTGLLDSVVALLCDISQTVSGPPILDMSVLAAYPEGINWIASPPSSWLVATSDTRQVLAAPFYFFDPSLGQMPIGGEISVLVMISDTAEAAGTRLWLLHDAPTAFDLLERVVFPGTLEMFHLYLADWYLHQMDGNAPVSAAPQAAPAPAPQPAQTAPQPTDEESAALADTETTADAVEHADPEDAPSGNLQVVVTAGSANVRAEGNANSSVVGTVRKGQTYAHLGTSDTGWFKIQLADGVIGYVSPKVAKLRE